MKGNLGGMPQHTPHLRSCLQPSSRAAQTGGIITDVAGRTSFVLASDFLGPEVPWDDVEWAHGDTVHTLCVTAE